MKTLTNTQKTTMSDVIDNNVHTTKSAKIRVLYSKGYSKADIARYLGIRYQHVRNVLLTPLKKKNSEVVQKETETVKDMITISELF